MFVPEESIICVSALYNPRFLRCPCSEMFALLALFLWQNLICSECGDEFTLQSQLAVHMEEHRQELAGRRARACRACGGEFETPSQLKEHVKTHCKTRCEPPLGAVKERSVQCVLYMICTMICRYMM